MVCANPFFFPQKKQIEEDRCTEDISGNMPDANKGQLSPYYINNSTRAVFTGVINLYSTKCTTGQFYFILSKMYFYFRSMQCHRCWTIFFFGHWG